MSRRRHGDKPPSVVYLEGNKMNSLKAAIDRHGPSVLKEPSPEAAALTTLPAELRASVIRHAAERK